MQVKDLIIVSHRICFSREKHEKCRGFLKLHLADVVDLKEKGQQL